jgi:catechol 2,3-dioxygenase-like lactoylglutathione lyase family enzyme
MQLRFVSIPVSDQDRAKEFYVEVLGFTCGADVGFGPDRRWVDLEPPGGGPGITLVTWFDEMRPGGLRGLVLAVDDLDGTYAALAGRGVKFHGPIDDQPYGRFASFSDPDGNGWVLQEPVTSS